MFKNTTGYNKRLLWTYFMANFLRKQFLITLVFLIVSLGIIRFAMKSNNSFAGHIVLIEVGFISLVLLVFMLAMRANINKKIKVSMSRTDFDFNETSIEQYVIVDGLEQRKTYLYIEIKKIKRYHHVLVLSTTDNEVLLIDVNGFTVGDYETFKSFIKTKTLYSKK